MELDYSGMYEQFQINAAAKHLAELRIQIEKLTAEYEESVEEVKDGYPPSDSDHIFDLAKEHYEIMKSKAPR